MTTEKQFRPYAPPANVLAVLERFRSRNLPETVNADFLQASGVPKGTVSRTMQALEFLELIDEAGAPTDKLKALVRSNEEEYRNLLEQVVRNAYREDFLRIDPSQNLQPAILNAFHRYEPASQQKRMITLFLQLCHEAGITVLDTPRQRRMQRAGPSRAMPKRPKKVKAQTADTADLAQRLLGGQHTPSGTTVFGVTDEDLLRLSEEDFKEVWAALGKITRALAQAKAKHNEGHEQS